MRQKVTAHLKLQKAAHCNLYVAHDGATHYIGALSAEDFPDWSFNGTGRVSPDGRWLAFMSENSLTAYDNRDAASGKPAEEVFLYHAQNEDGSGSLVCASCDPSGARPAAVEASKVELTGEH